MKSLQSIIPDVVKYFRGIIVTLFYDETNMTRKCV